MKRRARVGRAAVLGLAGVLGCGGGTAGVPGPSVGPSVPTVSSAAPAASAAASTDTTPVDIGGVWRGLLGGKLHLALSVAGEGAERRGVLESQDQGATLPIDHVTVEPSAVRFEIASVKAAFEGKRLGDRLEGTWSQGGSTLPLTLQKDRGSSTDAQPAPQAQGAQPTRAPLDAPVDIAILQAPAVIRAGGRDHVVYELHVTNFSRQGVSLTALEIRSGNQTLARHEGLDLALLCERPGAPDLAALDRAHLGPGMRAIVFLWVTAAAAPQTLDHALTLRMDGSGEDLKVAPPPVSVAATRVPVLGPPLRGGPWLAGNGPSNTSHHRRAMLTTGGRAYTSQRFAVDWVKVGSDGATFTGDPKKNESYAAYGQDALAVADGVVAEIRDGIPENTPGHDSRAVPITLETVAGNHVVVDLGGGAFAFWAHFQPGSLKVKVGDRVKRGQVLGRVGNSGNSTEPHLHFHVSNGPRPLGSEGIAYTFAAFDLRAPAAKGNGHTNEPGTTPPAVRHTKELPLEDEIVVFP